MMSRSQLDTVRARIADAAHLPRDEVADIAQHLLGELERTRMREALLRAEHADLVAAAQATLAASGCLVFLKHELAVRGHRVPAPGESPGRILADAAALRSVLADSGTREATR